MKRNDPPYLEMIIIVFQDNGVSSLYCIYLLLLEPTQGWRCGFFKESFSHLLFHSYCERGRSGDMGSKAQLQNLYIGRASGRQSE